jgi:hypothetical protein
MIFVMAVAMLPIAFRVMPAAQFAMFLLFSVLPVSAVWLARRAGGATAGKITGLTLIALLLVLLAVWEIGFWQETHRAPVIVDDVVVSNNGIRALALSAPLILLFVLANVAAIFLSIRRFAKIPVKQVR